MSMGGDNEQWLMIFDSVQYALCPDMFNRLPAKLSASLKLQRKLRYLPPALPPTVCACFRVRSGQMPTSCYSSTKGMNVLHV